MQKYDINKYSVETILSWVKNKEVVIPEIQRPFVWKAKQVRDLIDSLYKGYAMLGDSIGDYAALCVAEYGLAE